MQVSAAPCIPTHSTDPPSATQPTKLPIYFSFPTSDAGELLETMFIFVFYQFLGSVTFPSVNTTGSTVNASGEAEFSPSFISLFSALTQPIPVLPRTTELMD